MKITDLKVFENTLNKYEHTIVKLIGSKYGISPDEFMVKVVNAVRKNKDLLKCSPASLFGSIMYFAEIGLPFNTPEGFGYILPYKNNGQTEATPIVGYRGLIEIAYRNPNLKSFRIQSVYENDEFDYQYGTEEYVKHKPSFTKKGKLTCVYAIAKLKDTDPMFCVVTVEELNKIQKLSKSGSSSYSAYNNGTDVFNIMQSKVAAKLLFKMLPKAQNETLATVLENDNKFDYNKNYGIKTSLEPSEMNVGNYEIVENKTQNQKEVQDKFMPEIEIAESTEHKKISNTDV